ncbi:MAG: digeranylgeranylglycerophospholipid reductase [Fervidicoccaceae archaeon]|jgi:geranylgeranyl reductase family protein
MSEKYDVLIVGAGPAGSTLAYLLSVKNSYKVAVFDTRSWEDLWGKPCGNAIGSHHFKELGIPSPTGDEIKQVVKGISIYSPSERVVFTVYGEGYIIDRNKLGNRLMRDAVNRGVEFYPRTHVLRPLLENGKVVGIEVENVEGKKEYRANVVVDATGTAGVLKRGLPKDWPVSEPLDPRDSDVAFREIVELDYEVPNKDIIRIYLNQQVAPGGYWWFFPEGTNKANIGLGVQGGMGYPSPMSIYMSKLMNRPEISRRKRVLSSAGASVPTRRPIDSLVWNGFIVIGDAAFTVNPVHGGGMGYAMIAAYWASKGIERAHEIGNFSASELWEVNTGYMRMIGAKQASLELTRIFLQNLSDRDLEFIMEKRVVSEEDVDILGRKGELREGSIERATRIVDDFFKVLKMSSRPSLLLKLRALQSFMNRMKSLYLNYPTSPAGLRAWQESLKELRKEFSEELSLGR